MTTATLPRKKAVSISAPKKNSTKLTIRLDCGFSNFLSIRGEGAGLNWKKGITLKNKAPDEWVFETSVPFHKCEFKVLLNDEIYEAGPNRVLVSGTHSHYTPYF
jgi:hypothetical protein